MNHFAKNSLIDKINFLICIDPSEGDLISMSLALMDEITTVAISSFADKDGAFISYNCFAHISRFIFKMKEVMIVALVKFRRSKTENIKSHVLINHFQSQVKLVKMTFKKFYESAQGITYIHIESAKILLDIIDNLLLLDEIA